MNGLLLTVHLIICIFLVLVVLLQIGRGAELGAAFGSSGQAQSQRGQFTFMSKVTTFMAMSFMVTSFFLTFQSSQASKTTAMERMAGIEIEQTMEAQPAAEAVPTETAPAE